jgi:hypothetical protein
VSGQDLEDISQLEDEVQASASLLVFLSRGYFDSLNCLRELTTAVAAPKPLILVHELSNRSGQPLRVMRDTCPPHLRPAIFPRLADTLRMARKSKGVSFSRGSKGGATPPRPSTPLDMLEPEPVIPWFRVWALQKESVRQIAEAVLRANPSWCGGNSSRASLYFPGEEQGSQPMLPTAMAVYASPSNPGAAAAAEALRAGIGNLELIHHLTRPGALSAVEPVAAPDTVPSPEKKSSRFVLGSRRTSSLKSSPSYSARCPGTGRKWSVVQVLSKLSGGRGPLSASASGRNSPKYLSEKADELPCFFLIYLSRRSFVGPLGVKLAQEIREALCLGSALRFLLLHEQDGEEGIVESVSHRRSHNVYAVY